MIRFGKYQVTSGKNGTTKRCFGKRVATFAAAVLFGVLTLHAGVSKAVDFELGDDARLDVDVSLTYGAAWRAEDPDPNLTSLGNSTFEKGDMINNRFSALIDIDLQYKDYGIFVRPRAYYDAAYDDSKFFDETKDIHRDKVEILDAFAYGQFELFDRPMSLRIGKQVASWGESLFILNGISAAMSPIDATAANVPGIELKDLFLPVGQAFTEVSLTDSLTFSGFYQWEWEKTRLDETGAYFSVSDLIDDAAHNVVGSLRGADDDPDDQGQWGVALRYIAEEMNGTEFGFYYLNYHEKLPTLADIDQFALATAPGGPYPGAGPYHLDYDEDVKLYGASVSGIVWDTNVAAEVSFRQDLSVPVESAVLQDYEKADVLQVQVSSITIMPTTKFYDNMQVTTEFGINHVTGGLDGKKLLNDRTAWGGVIKAAFDYYQIAPNLDLQIPITWKFNPDGVSSVQGTFVEKNDSLGVALEFTYNSVYKMGVGYTAFLFDAEDHNKADRDFVSLNLKYTF